MERNVRENRCGTVPAVCLGSLVCAVSMGVAPDTTLLHNPVDLLAGGGALPLLELDGREGGRIGLAWWRGAYVTLVRHFFERWVGLVWQRRRRPSCGLGECARPHDLLPWAPVVPVPKSLSSFPPSFSRNEPDAPLWCRL